MKLTPLVPLLLLASALQATESKYRDDRPEATLRMDAEDHGVVLRYGDGPDECDILGARDVWVFEADGVYYMHYDAAGPKGWLSSLAVSTDLVRWEKKGPILEFGESGADDAKSASYGVTYRDADQWHMFYLGTPNVSPPPDLVPSFPYLTMKAKATAPTGPWIKQKDVVPFRTKPDTYYSITASPGQTIKHGDEYLQFFSATTRKPGNPCVQRTLGIARTKDLDGPWSVDPQPMVPIEEQIENSSIYFEQSIETWFLFTNHIGIDRGEYTDAVWVYWTKDPNRWDPRNKAVVLDGENCTWSKKCIGLPSVVPVGNRLALFYDAPGGDSTSHMRRSIGLAWLDLPLSPPAPTTCSDSAGSTDAPRARPNVIFLMDDQHRWDALGIVNPAVQTPCLDALARSGIFYTQAVCQAPMCVPSRNSMMLGLYPNQTGILRNGRGMPDKQLPTPPLAELFRRAGYQTAGFGKAHWGLTCSTRGFETRFIAECPEEHAVMMINDAPEAKKRYDAESKTMGPGEEDNRGYLGFTSPLPEREHRDGWVTGKCLDFIESDIDADRPLFLYLSFLKPHAGHNVPAGYESLYDLGQIAYAKQPPWESDRSPHAGGVNRREMYVDYWSKATDEQWRLMTMRYQANCTWIDDMFGRVLKQLKRKGILDNAVLVYCSDHGEMLGERFYRFNKYCLYESSVRVPIILSGSAIPERLRGRVDTRPAELVDLYPTLLRAAGIDVPQQAVGMNLLSDATRPASFSALHERPDEAAFMWRTARHKLILRIKRRAGDDASRYSVDDVLGGEFYDLTEDPQEWHDLYGILDEDGAATAQREIRDAMIAELLNFLQTQRKLTDFTQNKAAGPPTKGELPLGRHRFAPVGR